MKGQTGKSGAYLRVRAATAGEAFVDDRAESRLRAAFARLRPTLAEQIELERQRGRLFLFLPVCAIGGVVAFFALPFDPWLWLSTVVFLLVAGAVYLSRANGVILPIALAGLAVAGGFLSAALRTELVATTILERPVTALATGLVERVEPRGRRVRVILALESLGRLPPEKTPERVRVTISPVEGLTAGSRISVQALWRPPPEQVRPGGYDFARDAFFMGLGAVGANARPATMLDAPVLTLGQRISAGIDKARNAITERIRSAVDGNPGAIAAALVTGQRGEISTRANDALRVAGLYHVISISGLHMALFGGTLFGALRFVLALIPGIGLRYPIKKISAIAALFGAGGYLALSGGDIAAQRSFIMIAIIFLAVVFDRQAITMRNLAVAVFVAIILFPEAVLGPSFQMSFCAVMAIVAWYERAQLKTEDDARAAKAGGLVRFARMYFGGIVATTIAATLATAPYAAFHFQRIAVHSLPSNLIALPVVSLLVMPWALVGFLLIPFGLDAYAWKVMGVGVEIMLAVSFWIADWPFATITVPAFRGWAAALLAVGLVWFCVWTTSLRWLGTAPLAIGLFLASVPSRPDVFVEPGGRAAAVRGPDGRFQIIGTRFASFAAGVWLAADGDLRKVRDKSVTENVRCDSFGCTSILPDGRPFSLTWSYAGLVEDCTRSAMIVTRLAVPPSCRKKAYVIDGHDLAESGALALTMQKDGSFTAQAARQGRNRVWTPEGLPPRGPVFVDEQPAPMEKVQVDDVETDDDDETAEGPEDLPQTQ